MDFFPNLQDKTNTLFGFGDLDPIFGVTSNFLPKNMPGTSGWIIPNIIQHKVLMTCHLIFKVNDFT